MAITHSFWLIISISFVISSNTYQIVQGFVSFDTVMDHPINNEEIGLSHFEENESADSAARVFLSYINATTTVSASYALAIILGLSLVLLVILGLISLASSAVFTGAQVQSFGKRSLPDDNEDEATNYQWMRILQVLDEMEKHFRHLRLETEDCRKHLLCELSSINKSLTYETNSEKRLEELATQLSKLSKALQPNRANLSMYNKLHSYRHAILQGRKSGQCEDYFDKCSTNVS